MCFWNIHKVDSDQTIRDLESLNERADILMLQEVDTSKNLDQMFVGQFAKSWGTTGVATISDVKQKKTKSFVSDSYEFGVFTPKAILFSHMDLGNDDLLIVNVHALNFVAFDAFAFQMEELGKMVSKHEGPILIAGDFNTWFFTRTDLIRNILGKSGITEVEFEVEPGSDPRSGSFGLLDRAYVRGLNVIGSEVMGEMTSSDHIPSCLTLEQQF